MIISNLSLALTRPGNGVGFVVPTANWRLPITNAFVSSGDATWVTAMINSGTAKTLPTMTGNTVQPASTTRDYSFLVGTVAAPGGMIYLDPTIAGTGTITVTAFDSTDSVDGSAGSGSWNSLPFTLWKPSGDSSVTGYGGRGQIIPVPAGVARWIRIRIVTPASTTVLPYFGAFQYQANGSHDLWAYIGMSITNQNVTSRVMRDYIMTRIPTADPICINMGRSGANGAAIKTEEIDELTGNSQFAQVKNVIFDGGINDVAYTFLRPYGTTPASDTAVGTQWQTNFDAIAGKVGAAHTFVSNISFGNFTVSDVTIGATPYVNGDIASSNGFLPYNINVIEPRIKASASSSWSSKYDIPVLNQYLGDASNFENYLSDSLHNTTIGAYMWRENMYSIYDRVYSRTSTTETIDTLVAQVGSKATSTMKTRLQGLYDTLRTTTDPTALANRATLQSTITAITTTFSDITPTNPNILPNSGSIVSGTLVAQFDASEFTKITRAWIGHTSAILDRKNGFTMAQGTATNQPRLIPEQASGAKAYFNFSGTNENTKSLSSTDATLINLVDSAGSAFTIFCVLTMPSAASSNGEDIFGLGSATQNFILIGAQISAFAPRLLIGDTTGSAFSLTPTDAGLSAGSRFAFAFRRDGAGNLKYYRGGVTATATTAKNGAVTSTVMTIGRRAQGGGTNYNKYLHEIDVFSGAMSDAEIGNVLGGLREKWSDSFNTCV